MPPSPKGVVTDWVGFAKESGGLTTAAAAPAPSRRAKSRREIEIVFMRVIHTAFRRKIETELRCLRSGRETCLIEMRRLELGCDLYAIETAQATVVTSPAVPEKMADPDSAPR